MKSLLNESSFFPKAILTIPGQVVEIKPFEIVLKFGNDFRGRVHITEVKSFLFVF